MKRSTTSRATPAGAAETTRASGPGAAAPDATEPATTHWGLVALAISTGILAAAYLGKVPPALPLQRAELGMGLVAAGWTVSMINATGALLGIVAGSLGDRFGIRRVVLVGLAALGAGSLLGAASVSVVWLLLSRLLEGIGFITVVVAIPGMILPLTRARDRNLALGIWSTYVPSGGALALLLSPLLLPTIGWRGVWVALGLVTLCWSWLVRCCVPPDAPHHARPERASIAANVRLTVGRAGPWLLAGCFFCYVVQWVTLTAWLPTFLVEQRDVAVGAAALFTALVVASNIPGNFLGSWLLHHHVPDWLLILFSGLATSASLVGIFSDTLPDALRIASCLTFTALGGILPPAVMSAVPGVAPAHAQVATTSGLVIQGSNVGQVVGPPLAALLVTLSGGWEANFWMLEAAAATTLVLALAYRAVDRAS